MRLLLIDHDDSFTHILADYLARASSSTVKILNHRQHKEIQAYKPTHLILSPGPGHPNEYPDFINPKIPTLGICLGHQKIAQHFGATVSHAHQVMHGKQSQITHQFPGLPNPLTVMRYHSLAVSNLPAELTATAHAEDGTIMALKHRELPMYGLQFHPESIGTEHGLTLLQNFIKVV